MAKEIRRITVALAATAAFLTGAASAQETVYPFRGLSLGPRFSAFMPADNSSGWSGNGGVQLRAHMTPVWALEASADYRKRDLAGSRVKIIPVQASLLAYPFPNRYRISPYILAGGGWYPMRVEGPQGTTRSDRFGPHVGGGIEVWLNRAWSLDADARHVWLKDIRVADASGTTRSFRDDSHQVTAGLNFHF
ncbi:MAG: porin family protein [Elusimicrobiota bacterium]|nr:MAG: porin family protein [Elusimicrobiota bacterium]